jgi:hypothetical protein
VQHENRASSAKLRMTEPRDRSPAGDGAEDEPRESIMGSLPRSRPSVRSPRRDAAAKARKARPAPDRPRPAAASTARPKATAASRGAGAASADAEPDDEGAGLEDVARAGVTTAVQVATAGLRFAGKAAGAIRESLERR